MEKINAPEMPETMTLQFVLEYLSFIKEISDDDERAHIMEDNIYYAVIESISLGKCQNIVGCCKAVLKSTDISFSRHCG